MKIGIIGAENSHAAAIAKTINVLKKVKGFSVECIWGETEEFAQKTAEAGQIPNIVKKPSEMLGKVDAIVVDHRHGKYHLPAALPFVKKGIPAFIDKPFCFRSAEGREFLKIARQCGTPVTSFSTIPTQRTFRAFVKKIQGMGRVAAGITYGPADLKSQWGGVFFYGIHQVEMALSAFGDNVKAAVVTRNGNGNTAQLIYADDLIVTMNLVKGACHGFALAAMCEKGAEYLQVRNDPLPYLAGIKTFTTMFKTGVEPFSHERILKPVLILEAIERSIKSGKIEKVAR